MVGAVVVGVLAGILGGSSISYVMWRRWGRPTEMLASTGGQLSIGELAAKAADAFLGGHIIAGVGIAGVCFGAAGVGLLMFAAGAERLSAAGAYGATLVTILGVLLVVFSGALYVFKKWLEARTQVSLVTGYQEIILAFIGKVNTGTVNADQVVDLAEKEMESLSKILAGWDQPTP
jgi:HAMP domain-containing protein